MLGKGLHLIFGGQWGSEGKGKIVGYMATHEKIDAAISCFMPNAGHTHQYGNKSLVFQQVPVSAVNPNAKLLLGPTSAIHIELLLSEIKMLEDAGLDIWDRLYIHPNAVIVEGRHREWEKENLVYISSTTKGCGAALADKVRRDVNVKLAGDVEELEGYLSDTVSLVNNMLEQGGTVLGEMAQGFELSINHSGTFPYCTSRDCTPQQFLNDIGVHWSAVNTSWAVVRTYPIRVGNVYDKEGVILGYSGDVFDDQKETDWKTLSNKLGRPVEEITTVTKKVRRVFTWSWQQIQHMYRICRPNRIALTFLDYMDPSIYEASGAIGKEIVDATIDSFVKKVDRFAPIWLISTGPDVKHILLRE